MDEHHARPGDDQNALRERVEEHEQIIEGVYRNTHLMAQQVSHLGARTDTLVGEVGEVRGDVRALRGDIGRVTEGVDELRDAMSILSRHSVLMETASTNIGALSARVTGLEERIRPIETALPGLLEARASAVKAVLYVFGAVAVAVLGLVLKGMHL